MQSCIADNEAKSYVRDYGMVIVDEYHHVSAVSFEQVLKVVNAHYVYGLTATPTRQDGHQPIIFMQCGPIRYTADAMAQMQSQSFGRLSVPRYTPFRLVSEEPFSYARAEKQLAEDEFRNLFTIKDVVEVLKEGRSPIILSN